MTEHVINEMLQKARQAADEAEKRGNKLLGTTIIQIASLIALRALTIHPKWYKGKMRCRNCDSLLTYSPEQKYYAKYGYCFNEENVYGDYIAENAPEITSEIL